MLNFWTTEGATSLRNILPKAGEIKNIKNMMEKKGQRKHCDIYFVFLHRAYCHMFSKMCACKRHVGSRFDIGTNYRITADEQLLGSALATCSTVSYDNWGYLFWS